MKTLSITFTGEIWFWRGPAPYLFVTVPPKHSQTLRSIMKTVTYGWGMIPATVRIGNTTFKTSLFPKDGGYIVPIKVVVQDGLKLANLSALSFSNARIRSGQPVLIQGNPDTIIRDVRLNDLAVETAGEDALVCRYCQGVACHNVTLANRAQGAPGPATAN